MSPADTCQASFASPGDVIIRKMEHCREGGSEKHLRDITGILKISGEDVDRPCIARWALQPGLADIWEAVLGRLD